ncbi:MAG: MgtC/SapB family protein [Myxococcota bacterium]
MAMPDAGIMVLRIAAGTALGGVIGYERDRHRRPVGLRTHMIVALAASTFMILSAFFQEFQGYEPNQGIDVDASRIAASVVSGIGFLAGGAILRNGLSIQGLTTAAGLWLVTAIGMAAGAGMFIIAVAVTAMGMIILTVMRSLEARIGDSARHRVEATVAGSPEALFEVLADLGARVERLEYERRIEDAVVLVAFDLMVPNAVPLSRVVSTIESVEGLRRLRILG